MFYKFNVNDAIAIPENIRDDLPNRRKYFGFFRLGRTPYVHLTFNGLQQVFYPPQSKIRPDASFWNYRDVAKSIFSEYQLEIFVQTRVLQVITNSLRYACNGNISTSMFRSSTFFTEDVIMA